MLYFRATANAWLLHCITQVQFRSAGVVFTSWLVILSRSTSQSPKPDHQGYLKSKRVFLDGSPNSVLRPSTKQHCQPDTAKARFTVHSMELIRVAFCCDDQYLIGPTPDELVQPYPNISQYSCTCLVPLPDHVLKSLVWLFHTCGF